MIISVFRNTFNRINHIYLDVKTTLLMQDQTYNDI